MKELHYEIDTIQMKKKKKKKTILLYTIRSIYSVHMKCGCHTGFLTIANCDIILLYIAHRYLPLDKKPVHFYRYKNKRESK